MKHITLKLEKLEERIAPGGICWAPPSHCEKQEDKHEDKHEDKYNCGKHN